MKSLASYNLSKLAKEAGFKVNIQSNLGYFPNKSLVDLSKTEAVDTDYLPAPYLFELQDWLREDFGLHISVSLNAGIYTAIIIRVSTGSWSTVNASERDYYKALSAAIEEGIKLKMKA